jgi:N,N-dimethylformamidase beta subunit-like protein
VLIGYVSDERYVALSDVLVEFDRDGQTVAEARSTARGRINVDLAPGTYRVTLRKDGFGAKAVPLEITEGDTPRQFRLLPDRLTGYVWPRWVRAGEAAELLFHSPAGYQLRLARYGAHREFIRNIGFYDEHGPNAVLQITPDGDWTQTGANFNKVGYGNNPHHTQLVSAPERSGLYYVEAKSESGAWFAAPWIVAPAAPSAPIAVVLSTNTWNAYNNFGGRSNYINSTGLPAEPIVYGRQELERYQGHSFGEWYHPDGSYPPLSFERPEPFNSVPENASPDDPLAGRQANHLAPAEWRLLAWLERNGFAYDTYGDAQLDDGTLDLDAYKVLIISAHPEYWTRRQYERTRDWVHQRGGRFMYLGGNGINCEVEYATPTSMRTKTHLKMVDGHLGQADPNDPTHWLDSRFARTVESEAHLTGLATTETGIMTAAPYRVVDDSHWIYEGTGLHNGDLFGELSQHERVPGGASGHETDKMSANSPAGTRLLAKGLNPDDGGAEIVYYETASGGAAFSVGSIVWPASLLVDAGVSRITENVVRRFISEG